MASQINKERVYGNFKARGYGKKAREKLNSYEHKNSKNYKHRPGMSPNHLNCVRSCQCCVCSAPPRSEVHHLKATGERGMGLRSTDKHTVPLCRHCHDEVERAGAKNEEYWFTSRGIDAIALALALWQNTNDVDQLQKIVRAHQER